MREMIEAALQKIVGQPAWAIGRAGLIWIQLGERKTVTSKRGSREVGQYALHLSCPWIWRHGDQVIADADSDSEQLGRILATPALCSSVAAEDSGAFRLSFSNGTDLQVDTGEEEGEYWRLFSPGDDSPHFVVGSDGIGN